MIIDLQEFKFIVIRNRNKEENFTLQQEFPHGHTAWEETSHSTPLKTPRGKF